MLVRRELLMAAGAGLAAAASGHSVVAASDAGDLSAQAAIAPKQGIALALGGGAAKGFAHIPILEVLDELGLKPVQMAGTSMGAILGALYASGMRGADIRDYLLDLFARRQPLLKKLFLDTGETWASLFNLVKPSVIDPVVLFSSVLPDLLREDFSDLDIPLRILATDYHAQDEVVIDNGNLLSAIAGSSALPVLLTPVRREGLLLIDGGFVNPTPFDILEVPPEIATVGVDVTGSELADDGGTPGSMRVWVRSFSITLHSIVEAKLQGRQPDLLLRPPVDRFSTMDFFKVREILTAADEAREPFKRQLDILLGRS